MLEGKLLYQTNSNLLSKPKEASLSVQWLPSLKIYDQFCTGCNTFTSFVCSAVAKK